jgi:hypothetical protein
MLVPSPKPEVSNSTDGGLTMLNASSTMISTAATSSMNTPALLIWAINLTPIALITVVKTMSNPPRMTALAAAAPASAASPTNWNPDQI